MKHIIILLIAMLPLLSMAQPYQDTVIYVKENISGDSIRIYSTVWKDNKIVKKITEDMDSLDIANKASLLDSLIINDSITVTSFSTRISLMEIIRDEAQTRSETNSILKDLILWDHTGTLTVGISVPFYGYVAGSIGSFTLSSFFNQLFYDSDEEYFFIRDISGDLPDCIVNINGTNYTVINGMSEFIPVAQNPFPGNGQSYEIKIKMTP
jgi:hypothetical protein